MYTSNRLPCGWLIISIAIFFLLFAVAGCNGGGEPSVVSTEPEITPDEPPTDPDEIDTQVFKEHSYTVESLTAELKKDPDRPDLVYQLMSTKMELGDYQGALELLQTLDALGDKLWGAQGHMLAGKIIREKLLPDSTEEIKPQLMERALRQFEISLELDPSPSNLAAYWYLGDLQYELGNIDEAKVNLAFYLAMQPYAYDVRLRLAEIYLEEGALERARVLLEGMKTDPNEERRLKALALMPDEDVGKPVRSSVVISLVLLILIVFIALVIVILKLKRRPKSGKRLE